MGEPDASSTPLAGLSSRERPQQRESGATRRFYMTARGTETAYNPGDA